MTDINWSKAPEGATHFHPGATTAIGGTCPHWYRDGYFCVTDFENGGWVEDSAPLKDKSGYIARPVEWNGDSLPPAGTVCEHFGTADHTNWIEVQVIGHGHVRHHNVAFFEYIDPSKGKAGYNGYTVSYSTANNFRPIPTAEQKAAEERATEINQMRMDAGSLNSYPFEQLYDAGWRKVTP